MLHCIKRKGFQAAEAKIEAWAVCHRARKTKPRFEPELFVTRLCACRGSRHCRATRVVKVEQFGGFVKGFAGSIVNRFSEQRILAKFPNTH